MTSRRNPAAGFTLVEVMVALVVVALALPALVAALGQQVDSAGYIRDKSHAHMVAANKLAELRIVSRAREDLLRGNDSGMEEMAGREWYWWIQTEPTQMDNFQRIEIDVALAEEERDSPLYTLVAFMTADLRSEQDVPADEDGGDGGDGGGGNEFGEAEDGDDDDA